MDLVFNTPKSQNSNNECSQNHLSYQTTICNNQGNTLVTDALESSTPSSDSHRVMGMETDMMDASSPSFTVLLSSQPKSGRSFAALPSELILYIFKFLMTPHDLRNAILVCKLWCNCGIDLLWSKPSLMTPSTAERMVRTIASPNTTFPYADYIRRLNLSFLGAALTDSVLLHFTACSRLERLLLSGSVNVTAPALEQILFSCSGLCSLDLSDVPAVTDTLLEDVIAKCTRLHTIYLGSCSTITDQAVVELATRCTQLKKIKLSQCGLLTDRSILALTEHCPQMMEIDVTNCSLVSDEAIQSIFKRLPQIRDINMTLLTNITNMAFESIHPNTMRFEQLRVLNLTSCSLITDETLAKIIPAAPRLRSLALTKCDKLTDAGASVIKTLGKHLHYLHLGHCAKLTDWLVVNLVQHCTRIRYLDLACCSKLTDASVFALAQLPKLRRVGLVKCSNITDHGIYAMLASQILPQSLERMHLSYCVNLSESAVAALVTQCPKLTHLSVTGVPAFISRRYHKFCRPPPPEFTPHQREVFCVFSGKGVRDLRNYMHENMECYTRPTNIANMRANYQRICSLVASMIAGSDSAPEELSMEPSSTAPPLMIPPPAPVNGVWFATSAGMILLQDTVLSTVSSNLESLAIAALAASEGASAEAMTAAAAAIATEEMDEGQENQGEGQQGSLSESMSGVVMLESPTTLPLSQPLVFREMEEQLSTLPFREVPSSSSRFPALQHPHHRHGQHFCHDRFDHARLVLCGSDMEVDTRLGGEGEGESDGDDHGHGHGSRVPSPSELARSLNREGERSGAGSVSPASEEEEADDEDDDF